MKGTFTVRAFDAMCGGDSPTEMFGASPGDSDHLAAAQVLLGLANEARSRVAESFAQVIEPTPSCISELDRIIHIMWETGWSPQRDSFNLFCSDFGAIYAAAFLNIGSVVPVFRSQTCLDHMSFWNAGSRLELFPFQTMAKALSFADGEILSQMLAMAIDGKPVAQQGTQDRRAEDGPRLS